MAATRLSLWLPVLAYMALLFGLSAQSGPPGEGTLPDWLVELPDWLQHGIAYAGLALVTLRATSGGRWRGVGAWAVALAWLCAVAYGLSDEFHQSFVPGRTPDLRDIAADATGAALARAPRGRGVSSTLDHEL
ncbi:MAG: VanZ family protein [Vicinamibacterales bacterium]